MKIAVNLVVTALMFLMANGVSAQQSGTMRCRDGIVSIDDTIAEVLKKCGPPAFQDRREETRASGPRYKRAYETVTTDDWTYNFGPQEFMYQVIFQNGRVARIESRDQGY